MMSSVLALVVFALSVRAGESFENRDSMFSTLIETENFYRHDEEEDPSRKGTIDFFPAKNISICNIVDMNVYSALQEDGERVPFIHPFAIQTAATIALAMEHLNSGNGSIVKELDGLNETCNIRFVPEFLDTAAQAREIVRPLNKVLGRTEKFRPCAFTGAAFSEVTIPAAILTGVEGFPQISALSVASELDDKRRFPLFGRVRPTSEDGGPVALDFLYHEYNVRHLGVFHETNDLSLSYLRSLQRAAGLHFDDLTLYPVGFNGQFDEEGGLEDLPARIDLLKSLDLRYFFLIGRGVFYDAIFEEAFKQGLAGTGVHNWISVESSFSWDNANMAPSSELLRSVAGLTKITNIAGRSGVGRFDALSDSLQALGQHQSDLEFLQGKLPSYESEQFSNVVNASAFTEMMEYVPWFYDIIVLMGLAACSVGHNQLTGRSHYDAMLKTSFVGATGMMGMKPSTGSRDPTKSLFGAVNYIPVKTENGNYTFVRKEIANYQQGRWDLIEKPIFNDNTSIIPPDLGPIELENNAIGGGLRSVGYIFSAIVMVTSGCMAFWTFCNQKSRVIRASQPLFLHLICFGSFLMGLSIVPLGIDDTIVEDPSGACFGYPCLVMLGWCFAFTALFSKSMQVNKVFHKPTYERVVIRKVDVLRPMTLLVVVNSAILVTWFFVSPHRWVRATVDSDKFSRPTETLGKCESEHGAEFWASILVVNIAILVFAMQQAFVARKIATEFSESEYIARAMSIIFVVALVACPVMVLAKDDPKASYFVKAVLAFVVSISLLIFMFVPKIVYYHRHGSSNYTSAVQQTLGRLELVAPVVREQSVEDLSSDIGTRVTDHPKLRYQSESEPTTTEVPPNQHDEKIKVSEDNCA